MTQQEILEYNKMCAEILGYKNKGMKNLEMWVSNKTPNGVNTNELQFHSDWKWIMEVVDAIENLFDGDMLVEISDESCYMGYHKEYEMYTTMSTKKEAVVQGINKFLIWYYKNK